MTASTGRLSVCYMVPGSDLDPAAGPSRNAVGLARGLSRWADVTLAFRRVRARPDLHGIDVLEIDPGAPGRARPGDDSAIRGMGYAEFARYVLRVDRFVRSTGPRFHVLLEKSWLLSGYACDRARRLGVPAVPVENLVPVPGHGSGRGPTAFARHAVGRFLAGRYLRRAPLIVAETDHLRRAMSAAWRIPPERIRIVGVGIDRETFRPRDQAAARRSLGMDPAALVLLYVGVLDGAHRLQPAIDALVAAAPSGVELHVVGDGPARDDCERRAAGAASRIRFHGTVSHDCVPTYIAAADLCLAPYNTEFFPGGEVGYSTLKIREYLCSGRSVASIPSGSIEDLVLHGETGFLFDNDERAWRAFLATPPSRDRLRMMGRAAARTPLPTWDDVGDAIHKVLMEIVAQRGKVPI